MDKKDIYEHLAKIYLDASVKKKTKVKERSIFKKLFAASLGVIIILAVFSFSKRTPQTVVNSSEVSLVLLPEIAKINFNFNPAKKEIYSINLNNLNMSRYKSLMFSVRKTNYKDNISLRVEFNNVFNEKSFVYIKDIPHKWEECKIVFSEFKDITDWSEMKELSFSVEEWNAKDKKDIVWIDNIRITR